MDDHLAMVDESPPEGRDAAIRGSGDGPAVPSPDVAGLADVGVVGEDGPRSPTTDSGAPPPPDGDAAPLPAGVFENSLEMRFVAVPGLKVRFSIWETRVRDFEAYAAATGAPVPHPEFPETALQPKASVSRKEAEAFAAWLTKKERDEKRIAAAAQYRLPSDAEWDVAMEVGKTGGPFPWGSGFPPPDHFANYGVTKDGFTYTAPVGSFPPNELGLYDMAGNLWEWIGEGCASGGAYLVRGAGWNAHNQSYFDLGFHYCFGGDLVGHHNVGFRLVLVDPGS
jgi:formylglycine-generating enzyme required for sulfatase activity